VVPRDDGELPGGRERPEQLGGALELARLGGEGQIPGDDEVIDPDLAERVEEPLGEAGRVALAVPRREAVAGIARPVGDVQIGDVADADDARSR
jgi:hypothetical protein